MAKIRNVKIENVELQVVNERPIHERIRIVIHREDESWSSIYMSFPDLMNLYEVIHISLGIDIGAEGDE